MFGLVTQKAYDSVVLDLECERVHFKKEIAFAHEAVETARTENTCLKVANKELVKKLDNSIEKLKDAEKLIKELDMRVKSLESRWGREATI